MAKKAFLLGRNTGSLRHCCACNAAGELQACDVQLMQDCLGRYGFEPIIIPSPQASVGEIHDQLCRLLDSCAQEDTLIVYFSGHGHTRRGQFGLALAEPFDKGENLFYADQLIPPLINCEAGSKLLILDCCYAGESVSDWKPATGDYFRVLTATDRNSSSKEFEDLQAGVFTYHLHRALTCSELWTCDESGVLDAYGTLRINKLYDWLKEAVPAYGRRHDRQVPLPELYGPVSQNVRLATDLPIHRHTFIPPDRLAELKNLLEQAKLTPTLFQTIFNDYLDKLDRCLPLRKDYDTSNLNSLLDYLVETGRQPQANIPVPLLEFVTQLADEADNEQALREWVNEEAQRLNLTQAQRDALGQSRTMPVLQTTRALYLMFSLAPNDCNHQYYTAQAWFVDGRQKHHNVGVRDTSSTPRQMPTLLEKALQNNTVQKAKVRTDQPLTLEFFLPEHLLDTNLDDWTPGPEPKPGHSPKRALSTCYNAVVRALERTLPPPDCKWTTNWALYWNRSAPCRDHPPGDPCTEWVSTPRNSYLKLLNQGKCLFIFDFVPKQRALVDCLVDCLDDDIAMLLWPRREETWTPATKALLQQQMARHPLGKLPDALFEVRCQLWGDSGKKHTGHLCLLWDDPHRKPKAQEQAQPLVNPLDL